MAIAAEALLAEPSQPEHRDLRLVSPALAWVAIQPEISTGIQTEEEPVLIRAYAIPEDRNGNNIVFSNGVDYPIGAGRIRRANEDLPAALDVEYKNDPSVIFVETILTSADNYGECLRAVVEYVGSDHPDITLIHGPVIEDPRVLDKFDELTVGLDQKKEWFVQYAYTGDKVNFFGSKTGYTSSSHVVKKQIAGGARAVAAISRTF